MKAWNLENTVITCQEIINHLTVAGSSSQAHVDSVCFGNECHLDALVCVYLLILNNLNKHC